ncbi:MAG TPA: pitrilysin family protein [Bacteroidota bacterium]|nr:pitrilysin family protein [Bacteroidota bacterium]
MNPFPRICMTSLLFGTLAYGVGVAGDQLDRTQRPKGKPAPVIHLPEIQKSSLKNGLQVWLVENHKLPLVAFSLVIPSGTDRDPAGQPGIASMTADMLDEGTATRSSLQIADDLDAIGANLGTFANTDGSFINLGTLSRYLDKALEIYADVVVHPVFPEKDFSRLKKQRLASLLQQHDQPTAIANNSFNFILYGGSHPYGNNPMGTEQSVQSMTIDDLKKFYHTYYRPGNATLVVVGDADLGHLTGTLEKLFGSWESGPVPTAVLPNPPAAGQRTIYLIDKPNAAQSEIRIGYPALARSTPDYFPVILMNRMLGGQFTSRINLNLRERHGYTYGANSSFRFFKGPGPFVASAGVITDKTDSSLVEFMHELTLMREKGMTAEELAYAKKGAVGSFALAFETPAQIAGALQSIVLYGLPENYFNSYLQNIESVTLGDVQRVASAYIDPSRMAIVVVGDLAKIRSKIAALGLGEVVLCDTDGKKLP